MDVTVWIAIVGLFFTVTATVIAAVWKIRKSDKRELYARITHDYDKLDEMLRGCDMARQSSLRKFDRDVTSKLKEKIGIPLFEQAIKHIEAMVDGIKIDNKESVALIRKEIGELRKP